MRNITVAIAVDERMGIAFNKRRQSRDRIMIEELIRSQAGKIYVSEYSKELFLDFKDRIEVVNDPLNECKDGECCFVELCDIKKHLNEISILIIYYWNRHYPSDITLSANLNGYTLVSTKEFAGSSHEKITKKIYKINL